MTLLKRSVALLLSSSLLLETAPEVVAAQADQPAPAAPTPVAQQTREQLQQLVAPIALYPDALVAEILAASTYPAEVVEADRWLQKHTDLKVKGWSSLLQTLTWAADGKVRRKLAKSAAARGSAGKERPSNVTMRAYFGVHLWAQAVEAAGTTETPAIRRALPNQKFDAPGGAVRIDPENHHTWKTMRLGKIVEGGQFEIVWSSEKPIRPEPYPSSRSAAAWNEFLADLFEEWDGHRTKSQH